MIKNNYKIKEITMLPTAVCFCPLGNDWYKNQFEVKIQVNQNIPDYCEIEKWLDENIRGKSLIIEEAVSKFYGYLIETYAPIAVEIKSSVNDAKHFPVQVMI